MNVPKYQDPSIHAMIRQLQPNAVVNDPAFDPGDFGTPERDYTREGEALPVFAKRTEACQAVGRQSWGFRAEEDVTATAISSAASTNTAPATPTTFSMSAELPTSAIPPQTAAILRRIGKWYHACSASSATPAPDFTSNRDVLVTRDGNAFILVSPSPSVDAVELQPVTQVPRRSTLLNDGRSIPCSNALVPTNHDGGQRLSARLRELPVNEMANTVLVVKLRVRHHARYPVRTPARHHRSKRHPSPFENPHAGLGSTSLPAKASSGLNPARGSRRPPGSPV